MFEFSGLKNRSCEKQTRSVIFHISLKPFTIALKQLFPCWTKWMLHLYRSSSCVCLGWTPKYIWRFKWKEREGESSYRCPQAILVSVVQITARTAMLPGGQHKVCHVYAILCNFISHVGDGNHIWGRCRGTQGDTKIPTISPRTLWSNNKKKPIKKKITA